MITAPEAGAPFGAVTELEQNESGDDAADDVKALKTAKQVVPSAGLEEEEMRTEPNAEVENPQGFCCCC